MGVGFRAEGFGFRVSGLGCRIYFGLRLRVVDLGSRV